MTVRQDAHRDQPPSELKGFDDFELRLGDIMRGERATLGKSLLDVQRELKIKATYIAAIENSDPSAFETQGFIAGYVRSYARYLGLDAEWAFRTFCEEGNFSTAHGMSSEASARRDPGRSMKTATVTGPRDPFTEPSVSFVPTGKRALASGIEPGAIGSVFVLLALIGAIGYGGWSVLQEVQKVRFAPVEQTPGVLSEVASLPEPATSGFDSGPAGGQMATESAPSLEAFDRLYRPEALDVPVLVARDGPIATLDPDSVGALAEAPSRRLGAVQSAPVRPDGDPVNPDGSGVSYLLAGTSHGQGQDAATPAADPPPVQVVELAEREVILFAVRPAWVRVRAADGSVIFEKILDAGEEFDVPITEIPATLRAGNAQSVFFRVNGTTYGPAGTNTSVVSNVALGPDTLAETFPVADLSQDADLARFVSLGEATGGVGEAVPAE